MNTGACLCGALRYELEGPFDALIHCHCRACRKHHGAPFATLVSAPARHLRWLQGESAVHEYRAPGERVRRFCGVCGSVAPAPLGDRVLVPAGNLQGDLDVPCGQHIFVGSKAPWHRIADDLPQHAGEPPGWALGEVPTPPPLRSEGAVRGSCACGDVSFRVSGAPIRWLQCHCSRCRRGRSTAHGSNTFYAIDQFAWLTGLDAVRSYKLPEADRFTVSFCARCGGGAPSERVKVPFVLVPAALFDDEPSARPEGHIHIASKAAWYTPSDGLPQHAELPPP